MSSFKFNSITEFHQHFELPKPENPLFSIVHTKLKEGENGNCETDVLNESIELKYLTTITLTY